MTLWQVIQKHLNEQGLNPTQLARKAGYVNTNIIYQIKNNPRKDPQLSTMIKIADALDISLDEFREKRCDKK